MLEIFQKGGPMMYPILLCSVFALGIFLERMWTFARVRRGTSTLVREVEELVRKSRSEEAMIVCQRAGTPLSRIFIIALRAAGRSRDQLKAAK